MGLLQQIGQLLSEPPGNIIYYLATLLALQAVFGISLSQWRRERSNDTARRGAAASGALILLRVILLLAGLALLNNPTNAILILPPLEMAANTVTAVLLVWAFVPSARRRPYLNDVILALSLLIIGVMYVFYAGQWRETALPAANYSGALQWTVWSLLQIIAYAYGASLAWRDGRTRHTLYPLMLGFALIAVVAQFAGASFNSDAAYTPAVWIRLGYLIVFPLWAAQVYRQTIGPLLAARQANAPVVRQLVNTLQLATRLITPVPPNDRLLEAVAMSEQMIDAAFTGVGLLSDDGRQIYISSNLPQKETDAPRAWQLSVTDWEPLAEIIDYRKGMIFQPKGDRSRQRYALYETLGIGPMGALMAQPLVFHNQTIGVLFLARRMGQNRWAGRDEALAPILADYLAQALGNSRQRQIDLRNAATTAVSTQTNTSGRLVALEEERDKLQAELDTANARSRQAEQRAAAAAKKAAVLAATLQEMEKKQDAPETTETQNERIAALEAQVESLQESLIEAEEAMAIASAGEGGLTTEWMMTTITRYSGQLEEAQARIMALEKELALREANQPNDLLIALIQELRTPLTSIAGFTDLLLSETMGILGSKQRDLLQRVKANTERMNALLDQLLQVAAGDSPPPRQAEELVDARAVIETAVNSVITQAREKNLRIDLEIDPDLPPLAVDQTALYQIMTHLLSNACQASHNDGRVAITAHAHAIPDSPASRNDRIEFLQIDVKDSGNGIRQEDLSHVFDAQYKAEHPLIAGLGDTGAGLSVAQSLAAANGGRLWVKSEIGEGSAFSVLFPVAAKTRKNGHNNGKLEIGDQRLESNVVSNL